MLNTHYDDRLRRNRSLAKVAAPKTSEFAAPEDELKPRPELEAGLIPKPTLPPGQEPPLEGHLESPEQVKGLFNGLLKKSFPELQGKKFQIRYFDSDDVFFRSRPSITSMLNPFTPTTYLLDVNPATFDKELPLQAAEAIIAHELSHTLEYVSRGILGMLDALVGELHRGHLVHNERQTDMEAISRGYSEGLKGYREWIYPQLSPEDEAKKRQVYFSPEEISAIETIRVTKPELFEEFKLNPPKNLEEIKRASGS